MTEQSLDRLLRPAGDTVLIGAKGTDLMKAWAFFRCQMIDQTGFVSEPLEFPRQHLLRHLGPVFFLVPVIHPHFLRPSMNDKRAGNIVLAPFDHWPELRPARDPSTLALSSRVAFTASSWFFPNEVLCPVMGFL